MSDIASTLRSGARSPRFEDSRLVAVLRMLLLNAMLAAALFAIAGRLDWPMLWAYVLVCAVVSVGGAFTVDPALLRERLRRNQRGADPMRLALMRFLGAAHLLIGPLDSGRLHFSDTVPVALQLGGLLLLAASFAWTFQAMRVNPFFLPTIRIQTERGHRVIDDGLYRLVRHPGYAGMAVWAPASALAFGSWLALIPALLFSVAVLNRVAHEDAFLQAGLEGYRDYAARVRFRALPGIW